MLQNSTFSTAGAGVVDQSIQQFIQLKEQELRAGYELFQQYYRGEHRVLLTDRLLQFLRLHSELTFRDNFCDVIVDVLAERLNVIGFAVESDDDAVANQLWQWWQANRADATQGVTHTEAIMKGDSYVLVDWDMENERPRFQFQPPDLITPRYWGGTRMVQFISKKWTEQPELGGSHRTRLNLYWPDRVEKFVAPSSGGVWQQHRDPGETEWPQRWTDSAGTPIGVSMIHFRNRPLSDDFGTSELADIISLQDLLNKTLLDLVRILDTQAFPQRWTLGIKAPTQWDITPGAVWALQAETLQGARVGEFTASDIEAPKKAIEMFIRHMAGQSRTPQHLFHFEGEFPSGEALKTAEAGLVKKAKERQVNFGNSWEDVMGMALKLQAVFGNNSTIPDNTIIQTLWDDPETRNAKLLLETLTLKAGLGVSRDQLLREMGYSQEMIDRMNEAGRAGVGDEHRG